MTSRRVAPASAQTAAMRHCPLCGVAMQAGKSRVDLENFDTFQCLTCHTTIVEAPSATTTAARSRKRARID